MLKFLTLTLFATGTVAFAQPTIKIENAVIRAVPASADNSAAYFTISNPTAKPVTLVGGQADWVKAVELHQHIMKGDMMMMKKVTGLTVPAHGQVVLKPMGYHLMLIGLKKNFFAHQEQELTLKFKGAPNVNLKIPVKRM